MQTLYSSASLGSTAPEYQSSDESSDQGVVASELGHQDNIKHVTAPGSDLAFLGRRITALEVSLGQKQVQDTVTLEAKMSALKTRVATLSQTYAQLLTFVNELDRSIGGPPSDLGASNRYGTVQSSIETQTPNLAPEKSQTESSQTIHVPSQHSLSNPSHKVLTMNISLGSGSDGGELKHTIFIAPGVEPKA